MKQVAGWWAPEEDENLALNIREAPSFAGRATYQLDRLLACMPLIRDFRCALDIGAHIGLMSYPLSRMFARVLAWEPVGEHIACFQENVGGCNNVTLNQTALGAMEAEVLMALKPGTSLKARVRSIEQDFPTEVVQMRTLDSYGLSLPVDFIKIDCEGYELEVIRGGMQTIRRNKPVLLVEQHEKNTDRYGYPRDAVLSLLAEWGAQFLEDIRGDWVFAWP